MAEDTPTGNNPPQSDAQQAEEKNNQNFIQKVFGDALNDNRGIMGLIKLIGVAMGTVFTSPQQFRENAQSDVDTLAGAMNVSGEKGSREQTGGVMYNIIEDRIASITSKHDEGLISDREMRLDFREVLEFSSTIPPQGAEQQQALANAVSRMEEHLSNNPDPKNSNLRQDIAQFRQEMGLGSSSVMPDVSGLTPASPVQHQPLTQDPESLTPSSGHTAGAPEQSTAPSR